MGDNVLAALFGGQEKLKVIRFFLNKEGKWFSHEEVAEFLKIKNKKSFKNAISDLKEAGFIKSKGKRSELNRFFPLNDSLRVILNKPSFWHRQQIVGQIKKIGQVKLFVLAGELAGDRKPKEAELLVVGKISEKKLEKIISDLESDMGRSINYLALGEKDFLYRYSMFDRLVRDLLEGEKDVVFDKIGLEKLA